MADGRSPSFTFIHYGNKYDLSYRQEAREHNARKRAANNRTAKQKILEQRRRILDRQQNASQVATEKDDVQETESEQQVALWKPGSIRNSLTSFKRDQFSSYPIRMSPEDYRLESEWFSMFKDFLFLPTLPPNSNIASPQEVFFSSALMSSASYESLVQLPAATARADSYQHPDNFLQQDVFRLQANALKAYRTVVSRFQESRTVSRSDFEIMYALTFAFMDGKNAKEKAYNAMQFSNMRMVVQQRQNYHNHVPVVEWIVTMMPVPGSGFHRDERHQNFMNAQIEGYLQFLEEAQVHAEALQIVPNRMRLDAFKPGTALRQILTISVEEDRPQPHPHFYKLCRARALNYIHLNLVGLTGEPPQEEATYLSAIKEVAEECVAYEAHEATALFLWGLLTFSENVRLREFAKREELIIVPTKNLLARKGVDFAAEMTAWLLQDPNDGNGGVNLPVLDFDELRAKLLAK